MNCITNLQGNCSSLEERCCSLKKTLDQAKQELSKLKAEEDQACSETSVLKSRCSAAEARPAAAREQARSAQEEAEEWKRKFDISLRDAIAAFGKAALVGERTNKQTRLREDALRKEFSSILAEKEDELKDKAAKIEQAEEHLTTLRLELKAASSKIGSYDVEVFSLRLEIKELKARLETTNARAQSFEKEARILQQEKAHLKQKYLLSEFERFDEVRERCRLAEHDTKEGY